jgi:hypothetical protein
MSNTLRVLASASSLLAGSALAAIVALFALAFTAGASTSAGENAALLAGFIDLAIAWVAIAAFWTLNKQLPQTGRIALTGLFALFECTLLVLLFIVTLVLLNR